VCAALKSARIPSIAFKAPGMLSLELTDAFGVGFPEHRDAILSPAERAANDTMMTCCAGAKTERLMLDL
jgi:hypothetical protein